MKFTETQKNCFHNRVSSTSALRKVGVCEDCLADVVNLDGRWSLNLSGDKDCRHDVVELLPADRRRCNRCGLTGTWQHISSTVMWDNPNLTLIPDPVNKPSHYTAGGIECIDALEAALSTEEFIGFLKGNVIKYNWRSRHKGKPVEDTQKAEWYLKRLIATLQKAAQKGNHY